MLLPKFEKLLWQSSQRVFPARLLLIDRPPAVSEEFIWKAPYLYLGESAVHRAPDDCRGPLHSFFVGYARRLGKLLNQRVFLGVFRGLRAHKLRRFIALD